MFRLARLFQLLSLFLLAGSIGSAQEKTIETPSYYPLAVGNTWHYKLRDGSKFVMKVVAHEKVSNVMCAKVELVIGEAAAKKEPVSEHLAATPTGVYRYSFSSATPDKPLLVLKLPLKSGETWTVDSRALGDTLKGTYKVGKEEEVTVPAGKYKAFPVITDDLEAAGLKVYEKRYYAAKVGMIYQEIKIGEQKTIIELEKFEPGK
jgi:hypothetical protein